MRHMYLLQKERRLTCKLALPFVGGAENEAFKERGGGDINTGNCSSRLGGVRGVGCKADNVAL
jgi:hypothetical protein